MAMNLTVALAEIEAAIKAGMIATYGEDVKEADMTKFAEGVAPGVVAALQHIIDNAETDPSAERIK